MKTIMLSHLEPCICGRKPYFLTTPFAVKTWRLECTGECWRGPEMPTQRRAVNAWNRLMRLVTRKENRP